MLLQKDADPTMVDKFHRNSQHYAAENGHIAMLGLLLEQFAGADVNA
jgi:ankyrin repeat protein